MKLFCLCGQVVTSAYKYLERVERVGHTPLLLSFILPAALFALLFNVPQLLPHVGVGADPRVKRYA